MQPDTPPVDAEILLSRNISFYGSSHAIKPIETRTVSAFLEDVRGGRWQAVIKEVRSLKLSGSTDEADKKKKQLPAVTASGTFNRHTKDELVEHSGVICLDIDNLGTAVPEAKKKLAEDPHVLADFVSPGGLGLKVFVPITGTTSEEHTQCYMAAESHFRSLGLITDKKCKDVSRLCYVSFDPDCWIRTGVVLPFAPQSSPSPILLPEAKAITTTITTGQTPDDRISTARARKEANDYILHLGKEDPVLAGLYNSFIKDREEFRVHGRNDWLCRAVPYLFRCVAKPFGQQLSIVQLRAWRGSCTGSEDEHRRSFDSLWDGCARNYPNELSAVELGIYETLDDREATAFRICRDFAKKTPEREFCIGSDHLASRIAPPGAVKGQRVLDALIYLGVIRRLHHGRQGINGFGRPSRYKWELPIPVSETKTQEQAMALAVGQ